MKIQPNSKLLMIGDSITDMGRARPVGEGKAESLGAGYVSMVAAILHATRPADRIRVVNMGVSGDTVRQLKLRWKTDVVDLSPDWVSVMIGINDVWRQFDRPLIKESLVYPEEYEKTLDALVSLTLPGVRGMILMTPYYIEPNKADPMRARMDEYGGIMKRIARKHGTIFVDTQKAFAPVLASLYPAEIAGDRVHPSPVGHMVLALAFLRAIECNW